MKNFFFTPLLILVSLGILIILPKGINYSEKFLSGVQIPQNNSQVAGVQKYQFPPSSKGINVPALTARAVLVKDLNSGEILYEKNSKSRLPIASTTKIMTALVSSEYFSQNTSLIIKNGAGITGATAGLIEGESLSFRSLLYGMLLNSGNDAAFAIAENYPGGVKSFVSAMNDKAAKLELKNTGFDNPAGFDSPDHFSSAEDLSKISEEALKNPTLAKIFATKETEVTSLDKKYRHKLFNLNKLLSSVVGVLGIKTGTTTLAKENLVGLVERDNKKILTIVLGSDDRFGETTKLIEWTYQNFIWL